MIRPNAKIWNSLMSLPNCPCEMCVWADEESSTKCTCFVNKQTSPCPFCRKESKRWAWLTDEAADKIMKERDWAFQLIQPYTGWSEGMVGPHLESGFVTCIMGTGSSVRNAVYNALRKEEAQRESQTRANVR